MATSNPTKVGSVLEKIAEKPAASLEPLPDEELQFDPATGELVAVRKGERVDDRDRVPATQMAREGFFAVRP